jgi:hypothetical protein
MTEDELRDILSRVWCRDLSADEAWDIMEDGWSDAQAEIEQLRSLNQSLRHRICEMRNAMQMLAEPHSGDIATDYEVRQI